MTTQSKPKTPTKKTVAKKTVMKKVASKVSRKKPVAKTIPLKNLNWLQKLVMLMKNPK
jgi:hypothetical protein